MSFDGYLGRLDQLGKEQMEKIKAIMAQAANELAHKKMEESNKMVAGQVTAMFTVELNKLPDGRDKDRIVEFCTPIIAKIRRANGL